MKKLYLLLISILYLLHGGFAQTIIDPVTSGGFDQGNTFAANGWTVVNSSANQWVVGSTTFYSAPNSAYISSDGNVANYSYDNTTAHISHFYQLVSVPANAINVILSFQLKGNYEESFDLQDGLQIFADPSLTAPVADALPGSSAILVWPQYSDNTDYISETVNLSGLAGQKFLIIFTWTNDGDDIGDGPPASVDGLSLTYCIKSGNYSLTGGGAFCTGGSGVNVGLAGSTTGISYQLYNNGIPVGSPVDGTGSPITFGLQNVAGTYTVIGTSACGYNYTMPGNVKVIVNPLPTAIAGNNSPVCSGSILNLTSSGGTGYNWTGPNGFTSSSQNPSLSSATILNSGIYTVNVKDANGCSAPATTNVAITPLNSAILTSAIGTDGQTVCINSGITDITYSTTGATGATFSGLPTGLTGSWSSNSILIHGTPTVSGTFNYNITLTGGCSSTITGTLNVITSNSITLSSASGTDAQTVCTNSSIINITYNTTGATGATFSGLPPGVNGTWSSNIVTISGSPTTTTGSPFNYTVTLTGGCSSVTANGSIIVTTGNTIILSSAAGTNAQTVCTNSSITNITYNTTGATGATFSGLPPGVTGNWAANAAIISGAPTTAVGSPFNYTVTLTGGCGSVTANGSISVSTANSITLSSASGTDAQTVCTNSSIANITYTTTGATGATFSGLPPGVNGSWSSNTVTISGSPTTTTGSPFSYMVTLTGGCGLATMTGSITVVPANTIALTSATGTDAQSICINTPVTNITYSTTAATGATFSGLPAGVTGNWAANTVTITGTPTVSGSFSYTVTLTGGCGIITSTGAIIVTPIASVTSVPGSDMQTVCNGSSIININYSINNGTGFSVTGLPSGLTVSPGIGTFTISGAPSQTGIFPYLITITGGCMTATASGTITVNAQSIMLTSATASPSVCANAPMPDIVYSIGGTANDASVSGLPSGVSGSLTGNTFTIAGIPSDVPGNYNYTVTTSGTGCNPVSLSGIITITPLPAGGLVSSISTCSGSSGTLTLTGQSGTIIEWESSTDSSTWSPIVNASTSQTYTGITVPTFYRATVGNTCGNVYSSVALVAIHNYWVGGTSTDWNTASNWSDGLVPSTLCSDVYIPNQVNQPVLSGAPMSTITNLHIANGATVTINGTGYMQIGGTIANAGTFDVTAGTLEFNGTSQSVSGSLFKNRTVKDLIVSSSGTGLTVSNTAGDTLNITDALTFGNTTADLNTGGNITLKSSAAATASLGQLASGNVITGDVTVERYIATGTTGAPNHGKSWQMLATPTQGQTIKASWGEGATATNIASPAAGSAGNPHGGYGTMLTSDVANAATQPTPGFDAFTSPGPSIKVYNSATGLYDGPASTALPIYNQKGYFIFVRGDRSVYTSTGAATPTILRTKGTLFTPANLPPVTAAPANEFTSIGNPYASAIDMRKISRSANVDGFFVVWDPRLGGNYNYGAFQYFYQVNPGNPASDWAALNPTPTYPSTINNYIQSGQAFMVQTTGGAGTVSFDESAKAGGSSLVTFGGSASSVQHTLHTSLTTVNSDGSTGNVLDGTLVAFDETYSNAIDGMDGRKSGNTGETFSISSGGKLLAIERRFTLSKTDTIFFNIRSVHVQQYRLHFDAVNLDPSLQGYLEDNYLNTRTPLNMTGSTNVTYSIANVAGSYAANRFRIVFESLQALPVTFTSIKAYQQDKNIDVEWRVNNELNIKQYEVEKSADGSNFTTIGTKAPLLNNGGSTIYVTADASPVEGYNYYRVKSVDIDGKTNYTSIVKVLIGSLKDDITIYPNPITDGMIHLQLKNEPEGKYNIRLLNKIGQTIVEKQITHAGGNATELIKWDYNLAHGMYQLEITKPDNTIKNINVMY